METTQKKIQKQKQKPYGLTFNLMKTGVQAKKMTKKKPTTKMKNKE